MRRVGHNRFKAEIEATFAFPHSLSEPIIQALPVDTTIVDAGPGRACGRSQVRWLASEGAILSADMLSDFRFKNKKARIPFPEVFSYDFNYDFNFSDISVLPLTVTSTGIVRKVC